MINKITYNFVVDNSDEANKLLQRLLEDNKGMDLNSYSVYPQYRYPVGKPSELTGKYTGSISLSTPKSDNTTDDILE